MFFFNKCMYKAYVLVCIMNLTEMQPFAYVWWHDAEQLTGVYYVKGATENVAYANGLLWVTFTKTIYLKNNDINAGRNGILNT